MIKTGEKTPRRSGRPTKQEARDSRSLILEAALDLFSTLGYESATLKMIADRVGIRDSAVYAHFDGKDAIRQELMLRHGPKAVRLDLSQVDWKTVLRNPRDGLKSVLRGLATRWMTENESKFFRFMLVENLTREPDPSFQIQFITEKLRSRVRKVILVMLATGKMRKADPDWLVTQFLAPIVNLRIALVFQNELTLEMVIKRLETHVDEYFRVFVNP